MKKRNQNPKNTFIVYCLMFALAVSALYALGTMDLSGNVIEYSEVDFSVFLSALKDEKVVKLTVYEESRGYRAELKDGTGMTAYAPTSYDMALVSSEYVLPQLAEGKLVLESSKPSILGELLSWLPTLALFAMMIFFYMKMAGGGSGGSMMNFGKSKARMTKGDTKNKVTFKDVAGLKEEKTEMAEIVDFLKNPKKYTDLGARIPKGVLLVGPPGTGKTYIAKAVAGEAGVPFFSISGSDFVEMFVGVGASRVRDLFADAKKNAPCIVFIDEIDAVGRRRGAGIGGGNDERGQTLNQLLVEMDGFGINEGIIILAATNRPDVLDPAILRPGRFDRQITIGTPDVNGREEVFQIYAKNKPLDENVDLKVLAKRTPGFTPADIENMMNEAALLTARRNGTIIHMDDLEEAITRVIVGPKKTSRIMTDKEKKLTAFHEAGHAIVMRSIPGQDPVHQVTIMPRGSAGGFTMSLPEQDQYYDTKSGMMNDIKHLLGGRVAEAMVLGDISTGASSDLERATRIAHDMVTKYGMTDAIGPVNYSSSDEVFLGRDFTSKQNYSEELAAKIDKEVRSIIDEAYKATEQLLGEHRQQLDAVANALLEMETLDADQFEAIYSGTKTTAELIGESAQADRIRADREAKEAEDRAAREAEELSNAKSELEQQLENGHRVAVIDKNGNAILINNIEQLREEQRRALGSEADRSAEDEKAKAPVREEESAELQNPEEKLQAPESPDEPETQESGSQYSKQARTPEDDNKDQ